MNADAADPRAAAAVAKRAIWVAASVVVVLLLARLPFSVCPFANLTGHPCPGCGLTRAALALGALDVRAAVALHPLSPLLVPLVAALTGEAASRYVLGTRSPSPWLAWLGRPQGALLFGVLSAALLAVWIARALGFLGGPAAVAPLPWFA